MGLTSSKSNKSDVKEPIKKEKVLIDDPRSPTGEINRTPILIGRPKPYLETDIDEVSSQHFNKSVPLRTKLLRSLRLDPRSPSVGINRTPILIEESPVATGRVSNAYYDSPLSIYSTNFTENDSLVDVTAPPDPSVNVSDFGKDSDETEDEISSLVNQFNLSDLSPDADLVLEEPTELEKSNSEDLIETPLKVADRPNTYEAQKLMEEILSKNEDVDSNESFKLEKSAEKTKSKIPRKLNSKKLTLYHEDTKDVKVKPRTPLSNITSSTNSPNQRVQLKKTFARNKIIAGSGLENTGSPNFKHVAEWDQDCTVII